MGPKTPGKTAVTPPTNTSKRKAGSPASSQQPLKVTKILSKELLTSTKSSRASTTSASDPSIMETDHEEMISDEELNPPSVVVSSIVNPTTGASRQPLASRSARLNLENIVDIPEDTRQVMVSGSFQNSNFSKLNPIQLAKAIDAVSGPVSKVEHLRSGNLLITCNSLSQVKSFIACKAFSEKQIPVYVTVAWTRHLSYGKIYAPEFLSESLENILDYIKDQKVVGVRKLYGDPLKQNVPLYVLTFLGKLPASIKIGYSSFRIDKYYPSPINCGKCCRWGHISANCRGNPVCSRCGLMGHIKINCNQEKPHCINCKGEHEANSRICNVFERERQVCNLAADMGISFTEARNSLNNHTNSSHIPTSIIPLTPTCPDITNNKSFPSLDSIIRSSQPSTSNKTASQVRNHEPIHAALSSDSQNSVWFSQQSGCSTAYQPYSSSLPHLTPPTPPRPPSTSLSSSNAFINESDNLMPNSSLKSSLTTNDNNNNSVSNTPETNNGNSFDLKKLIVSLLPILIKLFLSSNTSDKIECFVQIGQLLQAETVVSSILAQTNLGSFL